MPAPEDKIKGSTIEQRLFVRDPKSRSLLSKYAKLSKGGRCTEEIQPLSNITYAELCESLSCNPSLQDVNTEAGNPCPVSIRTLAGVIPANSYMWHASDELHGF